MEAQLQDLIDQIKSEGVAASKQEAQRIVQEAEERAKLIIQEAETKAKELRRQTEQEIVRKQSGSEAALIQAGRNLLLATKIQVEQFFQGLLEGEMEKSFSGNSLTELILCSVKGFLQEGAIGELHLDEEKYQAIEEALRKGLEDSVVEELSVFPGGPNRPAFSLAMNDGAVYVDISAQELAELLKPYVNTYVGGVLDKAVQADSLTQVAKEELSPSSTV